MKCCTFHFFFVSLWLMITKKIPSENVALIFTRYLEAKGLRQTPERYAILTEVYLSDEHFDLKTLGERLSQKRFFVSRGTLYNTVDLLMECGLVRRFQLGENKATYEKAKNKERHDHLIVTDTEEILEFWEEQIHTIRERIEKTHNVEIYDHSLIFYGKKKK